MQAVISMFITLMHIAQSVITGGVTKSGA